LDWDSALDVNNSLYATGDYKVLAAIKKYYPYYNIIQSKEFLSKNNRFLVYDDEVYNRWAEIRIKADSNYKWTFLKDKFILVEKNNNTLQK
jgi:hypothetical protein